MQSPEVPLKLPAAAEAQRSAAKTTADQKTAGQEVKE